MRPVRLPKSRIEVPRGLADAILERLAEEAVPQPARRPDLRLAPAQAMALLYLALMAGGHAAPGVSSQAFDMPADAPSVLR
jgi:hypothetical protein